MYTTHDLSRTGHHVVLIIPAKNTLRTPNITQMRWGNLPLTFFPVRDPAATRTTSARAEADVPNAPHRYFRQIDAQMKPLFSAQRSSQARFAQLACLVVMNFGFTRPLTTGVLASEPERMEHHPHESAL